MENGIKNFDFDTVMDFTYKMLWDETYTQTKNRVNSGKNRYRIKNVYKRFFKAINFAFSKTFKLCLYKPF